MPNNRPPAEIEISAELVRNLIQSQASQYSDLPITFVAAGWDNEMYRLGNDLAVRIPRRQVGANLIVNEQRWLPEIAKKLPLPVPCPLFVGMPTNDYPWTWSVVPWLEGEPIANAPFVDRLNVAERLAETLTALHVPAPPDAPTNATRGVALIERDSKTRAYLQQIEDVDRSKVHNVWNEACEVANWPGPALWLHGDLHPLNLIINEAKLSALIDFGDLTAGDPATDYAVAWMIFNSQQRESFRASLKIVDHTVNDATWARAKGAALAFAVAVLANSADDPVLERIGRSTLSQVMG